MCMKVAFFWGVMSACVIVYMYIYILCLKKGKGVTTVKKATRLWCCTVLYCMVEGFVRYNTMFVCFVYL